MDLEEKILRKGIWFFSVWFICMSLFVWEPAKPGYWEEETEERELLSAEEEEPIKEDWSRVTVTVYNPVIEQCDSTPLITADNSEIDMRKLKQGELKWVAVSRDLLKNGKVKYGDRIKLECKDKNLSGIYYVHDTMHPRWEKRIDILAHQDNRTYGMQKNVKIEYLDEI